MYKGRVTSDDIKLCLNVCLAIIRKELKKVLYPQIVELGVILNGFPRSIIECPNGFGVPPVRGKGVKKLCVGITFMNPINPTLKFPSKDQV